jgi:hypothetical protein
LEGGSSGSHYVESLLWKRLWTFRKIEYLNDEVSVYVVLVVQADVATMAAAVEGGTDTRPRN